MINKTKVLPIVNLVTFILMILVNVLASFNLLGNSTREISTSLVTLLMPVGLTFSVIWTIIYILLIMSSVYMIIRSNDVYVKDINIFVIISNLLNILWLLAFHNKMYLIALVIIILLNLDLYIIVSKLTYSERLFKVTFSVYYAWITVAMFVSIFSYISSIDPFLYNTTLVRILTVGSIILLTILTLVRLDNYPYSFTIMFAEIGILLKHLIDYNNKYPEIIVVTSISLLMLVTLTVLNISKGMIKNEAV